MHYIRKENKRRGLEIQFLSVQRNVPIDPPLNVVSQPICRLTSDKHVVLCKVCFHGGYKNMASIGLQGDFAEFMLKCFIKCHRLLKNYRHTTKRSEQEEVTEEKSRVKVLKSRQEKRKDAYQSYRCTRKRWKNQLSLLSPCNFILKKRKAQQLEVTNIS